MFFLSKSSAHVFLGGVCSSLKTVATVVVLILSSTIKSVKSKSNSLKYDTSKTQKVLNDTTHTNVFRFILIMKALDEVDVNLNPITVA